MGRTNPSAANNTAAFSQLQAENDALKKENRDLRQKLERMNELLLNAQRARFGSSSEKQDYVMPNQVGIFNEAEAEQDPKAPEPTEETILVPAHTRKPKRTMDELAAGLPVKEILITLPEEELICQPRIKNDALCLDITDEIVVDVNVTFLVIVHGIAFADLDFLNQPHQRGTV